MNVCYAKCNKRWGIYIKKLKYCDLPYILQWAHLDDLEGTRSGLNLISYLIAAGESEESFLHLLVHMLWKAANLSNFDKGQIKMFPWLRTSIFKTALLMHYLEPAVVSAYKKWINGSETWSRCHGTGHPHVVK